MTANKIKIIFLGTNGWYDTATGNTICVLIDAPEAYIVLDAGNGIYKLDRYIKENKPIYLFLSHFHLDHIIGLHILAKFKFKQGIDIYVQPGTKEFIRNFINRPLTAPIRILPTKVRISEFPCWVNRHTKNFGVAVKALPLRHVERCFGFRFDFNGKVISYCPDTGVCENAVKLSKGADLLIAECAFKTGQKSDKWPHLNPTTAAEIAKKAVAKKLALVHFDAEVYKTLAERKQAGKQARKIFRRTIASEDGMIMTIGGK